MNFIKHVFYYKPGDDEWVWITKLEGLIDLSGLGFEISEIPGCAAHVIV